MMAMVLPETEGPPLNIAKCVMMSLVHDLAEADVGDITYLSFLALGVGFRR